jgi:hypothetical protein
MKKKTVPPFANSTPRPAFFAKCVAVAFRLVAGISAAIRQRGRGGKEGKGEPA